MWVEALFYVAAGFAGSSQSAGCDGRPRGLLPLHGVSDGWDKLCRHPLLRRGPFLQGAGETEHGLHPGALWQCISAGMQSLNTNKLQLANWLFVYAISKECRDEKQVVPNTSLCWCSRFCLPTRRSSFHSVWTNWLKLLPATFLMCLTRRLCSRPPCSGWINVPLVNKVLKRFDWHEFATWKVLSWKCWRFFIIFLQVLENIRLPLISPYYLHDVIEALDVVKENQGCQKLISEAKDYLLLKDRRGELYCTRARPRRSSGDCIGKNTDIHKKKKIHQSLSVEVHNNSVPLRAPTWSIWIQINV